MDKDEEFFKIIGLYIFNALLQNALETFKIILPKDKRIHLKLKLNFKITQDVKNQIFTIALF